MKFKVGDKVKVVGCSLHENCEYNNTIGKNIDIVATKADLKDGDIVIYRNGEKRIVNKTANKIVHMEDFRNLSFYLCDFREDLTNTNGREYDIIKIYQAEYKTVFSREEILDKAEKRYLAGIIRPFRSKVRSVYKLVSIRNKEFINIQLRDENFSLPYFEKGTMYKEMQTGKRYTLEELGL